MRVTNQELYINNGVNHLGFVVEGLEAVTERLSVVGYLLADSAAQPRSHTAVRSGLDGLDSVRLPDGPRGRTRRRLRLQPSGYHRASNGSGYPRKPGHRYPARRL